MVSHDFIISALTAGDKFVEVDDKLYAQFDELIIYRQEREIEYVTGFFKLKTKTETEYGPVVAELYLKDELVRALILQQTLDLDKGNKLDLHEIKGFLKVDIE